MNEYLLAYGGAAKALGDGKFRVPMVKFGGEGDLSSLRDRFTKNTDYEVPTWPAPCTVRFEHGQNEFIGTKALAGGVNACKMTMADDGIFVEGVLNLADNYESRIYKMIEQGKLGGSSGTVLHLIERKSLPDGGNELLKWPLGADMSFTPRPADPRTRFQELKSLAEFGSAMKSVSEFSVEIEDAIKAEGMKAAKGKNIAALKEFAAKSQYFGDIDEDLTMAALNCLDNQFYCNILWNIVYDDATTREQKTTAILAALDEYKTYAAIIIMGLLDSAEGTPKDDMKSLRTLWSDPKEFLTLPIREAMKRLTGGVDETLKLWNNEVYGFILQGAKANQVLSNKNKESLLSGVEKLERAIPYFKEIMSRAGMDSVTTEAVEIEDAKALTDNNALLRMQLDIAIADAEHQSSIF